MKTQIKNSDTIGFGDGSLAEMRRGGFAKIVEEISNLRTCDFLWRRGAEEVLMHLAKVSMQIPITHVAVFDGWSNSDATPDGEDDKKNFGDGKFTLLVDAYKEDTSEMKFQLNAMLHGVALANIANDGGSFSVCFRSQNATDDEFSDFTKDEHEADRKARAKHWEGKL